MNRTMHEAALQIPGSHPSLPGHFPGRPLVPGVVLLDCVLAEAEHWLGRPVAVRSLPQAKFTAPLLPEQTAQMQLRLTGHELRFSVTRAGQTIAQGIVGILPEAMQADRCPHPALPREERGRSR